MPNNPADRAATASKPCSVLGEPAGELFRQRVEPARVGWLVAEKQHPARRQRRPDQRQLPLWTPRPEQIHIDREHLVERRTGKVAVFERGDAQMCRTGRHAISVPPLGESNLRRRPVDTDHRTAVELLADQ
jgi:hypothetical protein